MIKALWHGCFYIGPNRSVVRQLSSATPQAVIDAWADMKTAAAVVRWKIGHVVIANEIIRTFRALQFSAKKINGVERQESSAVARKPRDAAAVLFGLKFADDIRYKFKSSQASKARLQSSKIPAKKTEFNAKWTFKVIQGHVRWNHWKDDKVVWECCKDDQQSQWEMPYWGHHQNPWADFQKMQSWLRRGPHPTCKYWGQLVQRRRVCACVKMSPWGVIFFSFLDLMRFDTGRSVGPIVAVNGSNYVSWWSLLLLTKNVKNFVTPYRNFEQL